jgi:hypothetical protein
MYRLPFDQLVLLVIQTVLLVSLCIRLWRTRLHRVYRYFFGYLLVSLLQTAVMSLVPFDRVHYSYAWMATEALSLCFYALIVLELYTLILGDLVGIATLSRRYIKVAIGLAIAVSLLLLYFEKTPTGITTTFLIFERAIVSSLLVFVLLITAFVVYYPVPLNRNVVVYSIAYALYFATKTAGLFASNLSHHWYRQVSTLLVGVSTACLMLWVFALSRRGETKPEVIGHRWQPEDGERLLSQLKAINASLVRTARK